MKRFWPIILLVLALAFVAFSCTYQATVEVDNDTDGMIYASVDGTGKYISGYDYETWDITWDLSQGASYTVDLYAYDQYYNYVYDTITLYDDDYKIWYVYYSKNIKALNDTVKK